MASYLRSWLTFVPAAPPPVPAIEEPEPESDDDADTITIKVEDDDYDDTPPAFPALYSAQRVAASFPSRTNGSPRMLSDKFCDKSAGLMPPPPVPGLAKRTPGFPATTSSSLSIPSTPNTLGLPTRTYRADLRLISIRTLWRTPTLPVPVKHGRTLWRFLSLERRTLMVH
ncbi:hypothetical protein BJ322DRAFT_1110298 [Thelephora terrestris]|uniref:Uncharacterized protein n=1 Tax=Thelephora terrestris TaxID=56493 RepID=A0A9P6HBM9_9AGAM|nr:hypothetical protein BJ322DRAFT_1110298 [Thelephora terrestris]